MYLLILLVTPLVIIVPLVGIILWTKYEKSKESSKELNIQKETKTKYQEALDHYQELALKIHAKNKYILAVKDNIAGANSQVAAWNAIKKEEPDKFQEDKFKEVVTYLVEAEKKLVVAEGELVELRDSHEFYKGTVRLLEALSTRTQAQYDQLIRQEKAAKLSSSIESLQEGAAKLEEDIESKIMEDATKIAKAKLIMNTEATDLEVEARIRQLQQ